MFKKSVACILLVSSVLGCTPEEDVAQKPSAATMFATKAGFDQTRILGTETVTIQTSTPQTRGIASWDKVVDGSSCVAESAEISVRFVTPAKVVLPVLKGQPSPLTISCTNGTQSGVTRKQPILIESNASGNSVFEQDSLVAGVIVGAIRAADERREARKNDAWRYIEGASGVSIQ